MESYFEIPYLRLHRFGFASAEQYAAMAFPEHKEIWVSKDICRQFFKVKVIY